MERYKPIEAGAESVEIDPAILDEAADWLVLFQSGEATDQDRLSLARWRARSPSHEAAWRRAEGILDTFQQVPPRLARNTLSRLPRAGRRQVLRLGLLALAVPTAWLAIREAPWERWTADLRTATGEQKRLTLADGTRLMLNTASAVDVSFTDTERRLTLMAGEMLVETAVDPSPRQRPLVVHTPQGRLQPLGTRFSVRRLEGATHVAVFEGAVEARPIENSKVVVVKAGEQLSFGVMDAPPPSELDQGADLWSSGMLLARDLRLGALVAELARYHRGVLRCDPDVASLSVSGSFSLTDLPASLALLEKTLPVRISRTTAYWITVKAR